MTDHSTIEVPLRCLYRGCKTESLFPLYVRSRGGHGFDPPRGWVFFALGFPNLPNLGVCPVHQHFTVADATEPAIQVTVTSVANSGVHYELAEAGVSLGRISFPTNTLAMQFSTGEVSEKLRKAGSRVAAMLDFSKTDP